MARHIVGVDLGTYSVKIVKLENKGRSADFVVTSFTQEPLGLDYSKPVDRKQITLAQKVALQKLDEQGYLKGDIFVSGLPASTAQMQHLPVPFADTKKVRAVLGGLLDTAVPFDLDELVYPWAFINQKKLFASDDKSMQHAVSIAFARKTSISDHLKLLSETGIDPRIVNIKSLALFELLNNNLSLGTQLTANSNNHQQPPCYALVDLGHSSTSICIATKDEILLSRSMLHGGIDVAKILCTELNISLEQALKVLQNSQLHNREAKLEGRELELSNALKRSFHPIIRELRQTFLWLSSQKSCKIAIVFLMGGLSKTQNICEYFSSQLDNTFMLAQGKKASKLHLKDRPEFASALSFALQGLTPSKKTNRLNFRIDDFVFKGELDFLRAKIPTLVTWALVLFALFGLLGITNTYILGSKQELVKQRRLASCKGILRKKVTSASQCLAMIREQIERKATSDVPDFSANDVFVEVARVLPKELILKITDLEISEHLVRMQGRTDSFEDVDKIVAALSKGLCFTNVEKGKASKLNAGVGFSVTIKLDCALMPGVNFTA